MIILSSTYKNYIVTADEMKFLEKACIEKLGISELTLMERAAKATKKVLLLKYPLAKSFYICCGVGGNAGDGFALARLLHADGYKVRVFIFCDKKEYKGDTLKNFEQLSDRNIETINIKNVGQLEFYDEPDVFIDALFGIGLNRKIEGIYFSVIEHLNKSKTPVLSIDVPSGLDASTGDVLGISVQADCTVTFNYAKRGHYIGFGRVYCGELYIEQIWSDELEELNAIKTYILNKNAIAHFIQKREYNMHKASFGRVGVIAGSLGMVGAAVHSAMAAYECGCGLVSIFADKEVAIVCQILAPDIMVYVNKFGPETLDVLAKEALNDFLQDKDVLVLGPGLSKSRYAHEICLYIINNFDKPIILDADALNIISEYDKVNLQNCILTPHIGEAARLLRCSANEVSQNLFDSAEKIADSTGATVVLKGDKSVTYDTFGYSFINIKGNASLAKGGSGDVLTGIIAALVSRGLKHLDACALGCYILGLSAEKYTENKSENTLSPDKIIRQFENILP